jgi:NADPH:quinone reductase-like Zn-dependent oxidoreductase
MISETMKAIRIVSVGKAEIQTVPVPRLRGYFILVKVSHVAINPTDWYEPLTWPQPLSIYGPAHRVSRKHIDIPILANPGATVGCDFSGTVVALGSEVTRKYKPGDRIAGVNHGSNLSQLEDGSSGTTALWKRVLPSRFRKTWRMQRLLLSV